MLTHIKKLNNFGVFSDYTMGTTLKPFCRYNVVYGENGAGKTTLSRLLACLEAGEHPDHPLLEYNIETQSGQLVQGTRYARRVRVFNSDYVDANIGRFDGPLRHIMILGEENKAIADELHRDVQILDARRFRVESIREERTKLEADRGKLFSQIAKTIGEATSGTVLRSYRKNNAEARYANGAGMATLSKERLEECRATVRQEQMPPVGLIEVPEVTAPSGPVGTLELAAGAASRVSALMLRTAQSVVIQRLLEQPHLAAWVEQGVHLHTYNAEGTCAFCGNPLSEQRLEVLAQHFSADDQSFKKELEVEHASLREIRAALGAIALPDRLALYSELRMAFDEAAGELESARTRLQQQITTLDEFLAEKLTRRTESYEYPLELDCATFNSALSAIQQILARHNDKTESFEREKTAARDAIEAHYLSSIRSQVENVDKQTAALEAERSLLRDGGEGLSDIRSMQELSESITAKQAAVSNAHAGGADLTNHLKQFLGRTDLRIDSSSDGYRILRRSKPAKRLSEGEKTAIAFLYFLVQLKDQSFDLAEGVVVIDDPISSLDASAIYQAFSFLKIEAQSAKQLFILTHNFDFLKLLINWLSNLPGKSRRDVSYFMVLCHETPDGRLAHLEPLDDALIEHATEYHYLFKQLYTFKSDGTIHGCYHIPNMARKVLETFLDFHVPSGKSLYNKLEDTNFDVHKKAAIYKFANDLSHFTGKSFDPALVAEAQKNTAYLLEMIETVAPLHYNGLKALSETQP